MRSQIKPVQYVWLYFSFCSSRAVVSYIIVQPDSKPGSPMHKHNHQREQKVNKVYIKNEKKNIKILTHKVLLGVTSLFFFF